jgi:hydrogenase nickel incorporation protein HypA/HybF
MALMESVREIVEAAARSQNATRVTAVRLQIGALATVDPDALRFAFDVVMKGGRAEGAALEIESAPGVAWCWDCALTVTLAAGALSCPQCGGAKLQVTGGTEMRVREVDLGEEQEVATCA